MGSIPACTPADADRAVVAARDAFETWSQTSREERAGYLSAIAAGLGERAEEIAATIAQELGMPLKLSQIIQAVGLTYCVVVLTINTAVDSAYVILNPKLRIA